MKYLVDIGNSTVKWAVSEGGQTGPMQHQLWREHNLILQPIRTDKRNLIYQF